VREAEVRRRYVDKLVKVWNHATTGVQFRKIEIKELPPPTKTTDGK
jgi:hypothetical protein